MKIITNILIGCAAICSSVFGGEVKTDYDHAETMAASIICLVVSKAKTNTEMINYSEVIVPIVGSVNEWGLYAEDLNDVKSHLGELVLYTRNVKLRISTIDGDKIVKSKVFDKLCEDVEGTAWSCYFYYVSKGYSPQEAVTKLRNGFSMAATKAEIVMMFPSVERWNNYFQSYDFEKMREIIIKNRTLEKKNKKK